MLAMGVLMTGMGLFYDRHECTYDRHEACYDRLTPILQLNFKAFSLHIATPRVGNLYLYHNHLFILNI